MCKSVYLFESIANSQHDGHGLDVFKIQMIMGKCWKLYCSEAFTIIYLYFLDYQPSFTIHTSNSSDVFLCQTTSTPKTSSTWKRRARGTDRDPSSQFFFNFLKRSISFMIWKSQYFQISLFFRSVSCRKLRNLNISWVYDF